MMQRGNGLEVFSTLRGLEFGESAELFGESVRKLGCCPAAGTDSRAVVRGDFWALRRATWIPFDC